MAGQNNHNDMYAGIPSMDEINRRLIENAREKRLLGQLKKMAEQRDRMREIEREAK